jgi:5-methyltetrahydrofolate--homocysteine methyltransferase
MASGELILPFVLQSAEIMKKAILYLEPHMEKGEAYKKGKIVLATVFGDVHDIGKNLVKTILSNNGYEVVDLGKEVPVHRIVEEVRSGGLVAVGLSALLVSTSQEMTYCVNELAKAGLHVPVIVGGAAVNKRFARRISRPEGGDYYKDGVFYAADAFQGLGIVNQLIDVGERENLMAEYKSQVQQEAVQKDERKTLVSKDGTKVSKIKPANKIPSPPFYGIKSITDIDINDIFSLLDLESLYRVSWKGKAKNKKEYNRLIEAEFAPLLEKLKSECVEKQYIQPKAVYGYFPCRALGDSIVIHDPYSRERQLYKLYLPRQERGKKLCLADYFSPEDEAKDVIALMVSTIGPGISQIVEELNKQDQYTKGFYLHGLGVQSAEAVAEYLHREIRKELVLLPEQGKRYSPGYSAWPKLEDQSTIFGLLEVEKRLGVRLTEKCQMVPEQSVSAMIVHHELATYF